MSGLAEKPSRLLCFALFVFLNSVKFDENIAMLGGMASAESLDQILQWLLDQNKLLKERDLVNRLL